MKRLAAFTVLLIVLAAPAWAGFDEGRAAAKRGDYATALREWRPLAMQGHAVAQSLLGAMYDEGKGVPQDYAEAVKWWRKAANQGAANAQYNLGVMYLQGLGVPQENVRAHMWFLIAEIHGDKKAAKYKNIVEKRMTPADFSKAIRLALEWMKKHRGKKWVSDEEDHRPCCRVVGDAHWMRRADGNQHRLTSGFRQGRGGVYAG